MMKPSHLVCVHEEVGINVTLKHIFRYIATYPVAFCHKNGFLEENSTAVKNLIFVFHNKNRMSMHRENAVQTIAVQKH